jgi:hypothetical protein
MARGVRYLKTKTIVKAAALDGFLEEFVPHHMIHALIDLCELAATHPEFDERAAQAYDWADQATDILTTFLLSDHCVDEGPEDAPRVVLDSEHGAIELLKPRIRHRKAEPSLARASKRVRPRILQRPHARN